MTDETIDLFALLPELYREQDESSGGVLRAFLDAVSVQARLVDEGAAALEDDFFIETCREEVAPFIGAVVGALPFEDIGLGRRLMVARTIADRQASGTLRQLGDGSSAVTGWSCIATALRDELLWTQNVSFPRLGQRDDRGTAGTRAYPGSRHELPRLVDLRLRPSHLPHPAPGRIGLDLRMSSVRRVTAMPVRSLGPDQRGPYAFSPLGCDTALHDLPDRSDEGVAGRLDPVSVARNAQAGLGAIIARSPAEQAAFRIEQTVAFPGTASRTVTIQPEEMVFVDSRGRGKDLFSPGNLDVVGRAAPEASVAVDIARGRFAFLGQREGTREEVRIDAVFAGGDGPGGPSLPGGPEPDRQVRAGDDPVLAIPPGGGVIALTESGAYASASAEVRLEDDDVLTLRSSGPDQSPGGAPWAVWSIGDGGGPLVITGPPSAAVVIEGLTLAGRIILRPQEAGAGAPSLTLRDATLVPGGAVDALGQPRAPDTIGIDASGATEAEISLTRCITGPIIADHAGVVIRLEDSIVVDHGVGVAIGTLLGEGPSLSASRTTIIGKVDVYAAALLSECLCTRNVTTRRRQEGCVRYSYVPLGSQTPRRHRCLPERAVGTLSGSARDRLLDRLRPHFRSTRLCDPFFATLSQKAHPSLREGGVGGAELGAFASRRNPQRNRNLALRMVEDLPLGMEAMPIWHEEGWR